MLSVWQFPVRLVKFTARLLRHFEQLLFYGPPFKIKIVFFEEGYSVFYPSMHIRVQTKANKSGKVENHAKINESTSSHGIWDDF